MPYSKVSQWKQEKGLTLNSKKAGCMIISKKWASQSVSLIYLRDAKIKIKSGKIQNVWDKIDSENITQKYEGKMGIGKDAF